MADPLNERDLDNRHSIADIEKMLFESKLGSQRIPRAQRKKATRVSLDPIKKLKTELLGPKAERNRVPQRPRIREEKA